MWCQHCGANLEQGDKQCPRCGRPREEAIPAEEPRPQPLAPVAPVAPMASGGASAPWVSPVGPPPTPPAMSPYPNGQYWPGQQPSASPYPPSRQPGAQPGGASKRDLFSRRDLTLGGLIGVVGMALGGGAVAVYEQFTGGSAPLYWAYAVPGGNLTAVTLGASKGAERTFRPLAGATTIVASSRPSARVLVIAGHTKDTWQVAYWAADALPSLTASPPTTIPFHLPQGRQVGNIFDLRAFVAESGNDAAVAVALTDGSGVPQIAYLNSLANPGAGWQLLSVGYSDQATEILIVGPDALDGNMLYARVSAESGVTTIAVDTRSNLGAPPATATPSPAPKASPSPNPSPDPSPGTK